MSDDTDVIVEESKPGYGGEYVSDELKDVIVGLIDEGVYALETIADERERLKQIKVRAKVHGVDGEALIKMINLLHKDKLKETMDKFRLLEDLVNLSGKGE